MSTRSEPFSVLIFLDATKFLSLSVFTLIEKICLTFCSKSPLKSIKSPLLIDLRRSKTSLLKLRTGTNVVILCRLSRNVRYLV